MKLWLDDLRPSPAGYVWCKSVNETKRLILQAEKDRFAATDDASVMEHSHHEVFVVEGSPRNMKLTRQEDLMLANYMTGNVCPFRTGIGYDVHRLTEGRKLILCGVEIPHSMGLLGHSDADVALHALMDAMLGAAALGDIGQHFPDRDPQYKGISSLLLLKKTAALLRMQGWRLVNADIVIAAQKPKLLPYVHQMRTNIAEAIACEVACISVKATTTEELGFEGRQEGISSQAVCLLTRL